MVEDLFEVEVERPFGKEISETASGQTVGGHPRAETRKRPAEGEADEPPVKKTRQESQDPKEGQEWLNKGKSVNHCIFCKKKISSKFVRHLVAKHSNEKKVQVSTEEVYNVLIEKRG
jgi:hypothetical protein